MAMRYEPAKAAGMLKVAANEPPAPEATEPADNPPTPLVPYAPMVTLKVSLAGKLAVRMVTLVFVTTAVMEKVGIVPTGTGAGIGGTGAPEVLL